ncbi:MAG: hypothetical protein ACFFAU_00310 [Candidatus Hodarchaeota archaeon]
MNSYLYRLPIKVKGICFMFIFVLVLLNITVPSIAALLKTTTTINCNVGAIQSGESLNFTIFVYSGYDPVPTGPIRIIDTNSSQPAVYGNILGGVAIIEWQPQSFIEGIHIFKAEFLGYLDFIPSSGECIVHYNDYGSNPIRTTSISINANSSVVFKNSTVRFTVELLVLSQDKLNGGYIYVKSVNLSGVPVIYTHGPLPYYYPGTAPVVWTFSFDYRIPVFSSVGVNSFIAEYTGSSASRTKPCISNSVNVSVMSAGYWLEQNFDQMELQRESSVLEINTTVLGDYPIGLELRCYYYLKDQPVVLTDQVLVSRNIITKFFPNSSVPTGSLSIITELIEPSTGYKYVYSTTNVTVLDNARIDHSENATEYKHNETIKFEVYITEEDVWTHPIICDVEIRDLTDGNRSIANKTTNQNGFVTFDYKIPDNASVGDHQFYIKTHNSSAYYIDTLIKFSLNIKGLTTIDITLEDYMFVDRNQYTKITITVLSGDIALSEGIVSLEFAFNRTVIESKACIPGLEFNYFIKANHPLGSIEYQVHYHSSFDYDEVTKKFTLTILSNPSFNSTGRNSTEVIKGQTLRIWGQLVDENGNPVYFEKVYLTDVSTGLFLGTTVTNDLGMFYYDYSITESTQIGVHFIEIDYRGNNLTFYHESINKPMIDVVIRPPLSVLIESEVIANNWVMIWLEGGLLDEISLYWLKLGESQWIFIDTVTLNSSGEGNYNWTTPYYKGEFSIRAVGPNNTKYDYSTMFAVPIVGILGNSVGNVNEPYSFTINSTEQYQIWIGEQIWQNWKPAGVHSYNYMFTSRGIKEIFVISNDTYAYYHESHNEITIYEDVIASLYSPLEAFVNLTINLDGIVIGEVSGPLEGLDIILEVNGTDIEIDSTDGAGHFSFSIEFDTPGRYSLLVRTPESDFYCAAYSVESIIYIHSVPSKVEILSPLNQTYSSIIKVDISGNAESYWYRIAPIDLTNFSWNDPTYRSLEEGNYTCFAYGKNSYGIVTKTVSNFAVDATAPALALINPGNMTYTTNDIILTYLTDEDYVVAYLDGIQLSSVKPGIILPDLVEGLHNLSIIAQDEVGNRIDAIALFMIDTIPPSLTIISPFNQSYLGNIEIELKSNGTTLLYNIPGIHEYNQTYSAPVMLNLSLGNYVLNTYAYDNAGNFKTERVEFSIVKSIELLLNSNLKSKDDAGNYIISTQILNHSNLEAVGLLINGIFSGFLEKDLINPDYQLSFQLDTPGVWKITLYAKTTLDEYDFNYYTIKWDPLPPIFDSFECKWISSYYEVQVKLNSGSLSIESVKVSVEGIEYSLVYEYFGDRWVGNLPISPQNTTIIFSAWYPWDEIPSARKEYHTKWLAPSIRCTNYEVSRENFTLDVLIEKQNASIDSNSVILVVYNESVQFNISGFLTFKSQTGSYQEWTFLSPNLPREVWNFTLYAEDIYEITRSLTGLFNATDTPPFFTNEPLISKDQSFGDRALYRVEVAVEDDYKVEKVFLYVDGIPVQPIRANNTHFIFEVYLIQGIHTLRIVAYDDIDQKTTMILDSIEVNIMDIESNTSIAESTSFPSTESQSKDDETVLAEGQINNIIELGLAGSIFTILVALGNIIRRKRGI